MSCQDRSEAERRAVDLQRAVARQVVTAPNGAQLAMSISVGVALITPATGQSSADLLKAADNALYEAKNQGRNRVVVAR